MQRFLLTNVGGTIKKEIMPKQFIKITKTNVHKNKVQKLCQDELNNLDQTVFPDLKEAIRFINMCFDHAISSYTGSAKKPELRNFSPKD